jgi:hypothetical protein
VLLLRDDDRESERRIGLEQARKESRLHIPIVIGLACTKRECWVLAGFEPQNDREQELFDDMRQQLGFDPTRCAEQLRAKNDDAKKSAIRVLNDLTGGDKARQAGCWSITDLAVLAERGIRSGLAAYLDEVKSLFVPLFAPAPRK